LFVFGYKRVEHPYITELCPIKEKPAAQTAHLVFADTKANAKKTKRAVFCQRTPRIMRIEI
jgi:hypothetical protein